MGDAQGKEQVGYAKNHLQNQPPLAPFVVIALPICTLKLGDYFDQIRLYPAYATSRQSDSFHFQPK